MTDLDQFQSWIQRKATEQRFFAGTFWFVFSTLGDADLRRVLGSQTPLSGEIPLADWAATVSVRKRTGSSLQATFWHLPVCKDGIHVFFSLEKPSQAIRPIYRLLAKAGGKAHLFPIGHPLIKACVRVISSRSFEETYIVRGVSYPSRPYEGGADINLRPGNAAIFFHKLEDDKRVLKTARMRAPVDERALCEFTVSRVGCISFHKGAFAPLMTLMVGRLAGAMLASVKPFERAKGQFVSFNFSEPFFADRASYGNVLNALSRLPRTSVALLHVNPYFYATVTNYEDGGEFDVFITGHSAIEVQARGEASPASFLRLQDGLTELFRDTTVVIQDKPTQYHLRDLLEGRV